MAAGKPAYAARKEKEAQMLKDLQEAKDSLHDQVEVTEKQDLPETHHQIPWLGIWIVGLVGLGAVASWYFQHKTAPSKNIVLETSKKSSI